MLESKRNMAPSSEPPTLPLPDALGDEEMDDEPVDVGMNDLLEHLDEGDASANAPSSDDFGVVLAEGPDDGDDGEPDDQLDVGVPLRLNEPVAEFDPDANATARSANWGDAEADTARRDHGWQLPTLPDDEATDDPHMDESATELVTPLGRSLPELDGDDDQQAPSPERSIDLPELPPLDDDDE